MGFDTNLQKEIWLKHIEVQERVLQLNSVPIAIEPETILISGQRLKLRVCQTDELDTKIDRVKSFFGVSEMPLTTTMIPSSVMHALILTHMISLN